MVLIWIFAASLLILINCPCMLMSDSHNSMENVWFAAIMYILYKTINGKNRLRIETSSFFFSLYFCSCVVGLLLLFSHSVIENNWLTMEMEKIFTSHSLFNNNKQLISNAFFFFFCDMFYSRNTTKLTRNGLEICK